MRWWVLRCEGKRLLVVWEPVLASALVRGELIPCRILCNVPSSAGADRLADRASRRRSLRQSREEHVVGERVRGAEGGRVSCGARARIGVVAAGGVLKGWVGSASAKDVSESDGAALSTKADVPIGR